MKRKKKQLRTLESYTHSPYLYETPNPFTDTAKKITTIALIGSVSAVVVGYVLVRVGVSKRKTEDPYVASSTGLKLANAGEWALFGGSLATFSALGALVAGKVNDSDIAAGVGAAAGAIVGFIPAAISTMILAGDVGTGPH